MVLGLRLHSVFTQTALVAYVEHDDVIAWHSTICQVNDCGPVEIPYRAILPQGVENMSPAGLDAGSVQDAFHIGFVDVLLEFQIQGLALFFLLLGHPA